MYQINNCLLFFVAVVVDITVAPVVYERISIDRLARTEIVDKIEWTNAVGRQFAIGNVDG